MKGKTINTGRPFSVEVTETKIKIFIDEMLTYKNCATFQRRIGATIVRACFKVHSSINSGACVYTLTYADDNNQVKTLVDKCICRNSNLHDLIQDFKRTIEWYTCNLSE